MSKKVLMFSATWCGPCKQAKPLFQKLSEERSDVQFEIVDIDEQKELTEQFAIAGVPTFVILENGTESKRLIGGANVKKLNEALGG